MMCNLKWWHFNQNNSGGYYIENGVVGADVFIQAKSSVEAADKAYSLFEDYSEYCECCGERWSVWSNSSEANAKDNPSFFSRDLTKVAYNPITGSSRSYAVLHHYDGRITKLKCGELYKEVVQ